MKASNIFEKNYQDLRSAIINALKRRTDLDNPYLISGNKTYSKKELISEIQNETKVGSRMIHNLIKLSIDLIDRDKEKLDDFKKIPKNPGHYCYGCKEYFRDSNPSIAEHKGCKGQKSLGICVDSKEFGEYHYYNIKDKSKSELIDIIRALTK